MTNKRSFICVSQAKYVFSLSFWEKKYKINKTNQKLKKKYKVGLCEFVLRQSQMKGNEPYAGDVLLFEKYPFACTSYISMLLDTACKQQCKKNRFFCCFFLCDSMRSVRFNNCVFSLTIFVCWIARHHLFNSANHTTRHPNQQKTYQT